MLSFIENLSQTIITFSQLLLIVLAGAIGLLLLSRSVKKYQVNVRNRRRHEAGSQELAKLEVSVASGPTSRTLMPADLYQQTLYREMHAGDDGSSCSVLSIKIENYQHLKLKYGAHQTQSIIDLTVDRLLLAAKADDILCRVREDEFSLMLHPRRSSTTANIQRQIKAMLTVELPLAYNCSVMLITSVTNALPFENIKSNQ